MLSEMGQYLEEAEKSRKGQMKKKLLDWGGALDLCARKAEGGTTAKRTSENMGGKRFYGRTAHFGGN